MLVAGGEFSSAGSSSASYIATWNGSSWSSISGGVEDRVYAFTIYNNELVAAGQFRSVGGVSANRIARWTGSQWSAFGSGVDDKVEALMVIGNALVAGGEFFQAGGTQSRKIAAWNYNPTSISNTGNAISEKYQLSQNYPNPFNPSTSIDFNLPSQGFVSLKIFDLAGKEVADLVNGNLNAGQYKYTFDASELSTGVYFYKLQSGDFVQTRKMTLIK
jgi:hypothetical protein